MLGDGSVYLLPAGCPHRGGPLRLGTIDTEGQAVLCPWHDNPVKIRWLRNRALPLIQRQSGPWTAIVPESAGASRPVRRAVILHRPIAAGCNTTSNTPGDDES